MTSKLMNRSRNDRKSVGAPPPRNALDTAPLIIGTDVNTVQRSFVVVPVVRRTVHIPLFKEIFRV